MREGGDAAVTRFALKLALFLLLGAIINVALAWGFAAFVTLDWRQQGTEVECDHFSEWPGDHNSRFVGYTAFRWKRGGSVRVSVFPSINFDGPGRNATS